MKILIPTTEFKSVISFGTLGDTIENLVKGLINKSNEVCVCMPFYKKLFVSDSKIKLSPVSSDTAEILGHPVIFWKTEINNVTVYLIQNDYFFTSRDKIYGYDDDNYRFVFFCSCVATLLSKIEFKPDIIHVHDWHGAFLPLLLKINNIDIKTVFTIHDISYQGVSNLDILNFAKIDHKYFSIENLEFYNNVNILKAGLVYSDAITTNSKNYLEEIQANYNLSKGLSGLLKLLDYKSHAIPLGIDESYNPKTDTSIYANYSIDNLFKKINCKDQLQKELNLLVNTEVPIITISTSNILEEEIILLNSIIPYISKMEVYVIILGYKLADFEKHIRELPYRANCSVISIENNDENIRKTFAGSDIFLDTSIKATNDQTIKIALKYGVIPIVFKESKDLEIDDNRFRFFNFTATDLINTIKHAINRYYYLAQWNEKVKKIMNFNFSWNKTIDGYIDVYKNLLEKTE